MMENRTTRVLCGVDELRRHVEDSRNDDRLHTASDVVVEEIDKIVAAGQFPYNSLVQRAVEIRLGIERQCDSGSALSGVVYASQEYRDYQRLVAEGFAPFTPELLRQAYAGRAQIEVRREGVLGTSLVRLKPRMSGGKLYAMMPRVRSYHVSPVGQPARLAN